MCFDVYILRFTLELHISFLPIAGIIYSSNEQISKYTRGIHAQVSTDCKFKLPVWMFYTGNYRFSIHRIRDVHFTEGSVARNWLCGVLYAGVDRMWIDLPWWSEIVCDLLIS